MLVISERIRIPLRELRFEFVRSSGPGGQNVNKVATKAVLRWNVQKSPSLPEAVRERFLERYPRRVSARGEVRITSQRFRDRGRNVADCTEKLRALLASVATPPKRRRATRPSRAVRERRLDEKRRTAQRKLRRRRATTDE